VSLWGRIFAAGYDRLMAGTEKAGLASHRKHLLHDVRGRVLEIGGGTGANLGHYPTDVEEIVIAEPEEPMARRLEAKLSAFAQPARVVRAPGENLPFEDASFDVAVSTLVLCTVTDPDRALAEIHRVLKPGGQLLFIEHVRSDEAKLGRWQDRLNGMQRRVAHGCNCNRRTLDTIESAGFAITNLERHRLPKAPPIVRPLILGTAERA
jgi:ubiquinone/menaquinone biosynthesis C-methylase UbiE